MNILPIQVIPEGVLIPLHYLNDAHEFELEVVDNHLLVRPKANGRPEAAQNEPVLEQDEAALLARYPWIGSGRSEQATVVAEPNPVKNWLSDLIAISEKEDPDVPEPLEERLLARYPWIGSAHSGQPTASVEVEQILAAEIDNRAGWTTKK